MEPAAFGADVTKGQFIKLAFALCLGTLVEWYDFTVYSQLATVITSNFFPSHNAAVAQLSFWAVYAVGFIARPLGAVIFGHIGDAHGRRMTLLISVLLINLPTLLIGCLPTYAHIGLAAPIIMALLRFIQGIAVGGEFGSAITYLYEMAPLGRKGFISSLGQAAIGPGIILGILVCQVVLYGCTPAQLELWGWRVPFLATVFTAPLALYLRMHMPEPYEYLQDWQHMVLQRVASTAANKVAHSFVLQHAPQGASFTRQHTLRALSALRLSSLSATSPTDKPAAAAAAVGHDQCRVGREHNVSVGDAPAGVRQLSARQLSLQLRRSVSITEDGKLVPDVSSKQQQQQQQHGKGGAGPLPLSCEQEFQQEVTSLSGVIKHHAPLAVLFKEHWQGVLLQFLLEACYGTAFYTLFTWVPSYLSSSMHVTASNTLWALLLGLLLFAALCLLTGHFIGDSHVPKVWAMITIVGVIAVAIMPVMAVLQTGHPIGLWLLLPVMLGLNGIIGGIMTTIGPQIYPAAVRASGYNLGHNLAMSVFGGLCPLIVSSLSVALQPATYAAGVVVVLTAVITWAASVALMKAIPATNAACPAGAHVEFLKQQQQTRREGLQEVMVTGP